MNKQKYNKHQQLFLSDNFGINFIRQQQQNIKPGASFMRIFYQHREYEI
jgi:hypothetical protein